MLWWVVPDTNPPNLADELLARGFTAVADMPGMLADLRTLASAPLPGGVTIERVTDAASATAWCEITCESFALSPRLNAVFHGLLMASAASAGGRTHHFLGLLDGAPVATASLVTAHDAAGIYCVATLPAARRRGIGAAMTRHAMHVARTAGIVTAMLQASPAGEAVYREIGFEERCRVRQYLWKP